MMGALKREFFSHQILNKNRLCLAHYSLNRSFTVFGYKSVKYCMETLKHVYFMYSVN